MKVNSLWLLPVVLPVLPVFGKLTARKIIRPEVCLEKVEDLRATRSEKKASWLLISYWPLMAPVDPKASKRKNLHNSARPKSS